MVSLLWPAVVCVYNFSGKSGPWFGRLRCFRKVVIKNSITGGKTNVRQERETGKETAGKAQSNTGRGRHPDSAAVRHVWRRRGIRAEPVSYTHLAWG